MPVRVIGMVLMSVAVAVGMHARIAVIPVRRVIGVRYIRVRSGSVGMRSVVMVVMVVVRVAARRIHVKIGMDGDLIHMRHITVYVVMRRR